MRKVKTMKCKNFCRNCIHYFDDPIDMYCWDDRCRRLQTKYCDPVYPDNYYYQGKLLWCSSEREVSNTLLERIFGENKDKCGKEGRYYERHDKFYD